MINIYLCEDDQVQLECWKNRIEKYSMIHGDILCLLQLMMRWRR